MTAAFPKSSIFWLAMEGNASPVTDQASREAFRDRDIAFAKAAYNSGNELAVLDAWYLCGGTGETPEWVQSAMPVDPYVARHLAVRTGRNSRAIQFTRNNGDHFERHNAVLIAVQRENVPWTRPAIAPNELTGKPSLSQQDAFDRAVELLTYRSKFVSVETVRRSYKRVAHNLKAGRDIDYWYPSSGQLQNLIRPHGNHDRLCYPRE